MTIFKIKKRVASPPVIRPGVLNSTLSRPGGHPDRQQPDVDVTPPADSKRTRRARYPGLVFYSRLVAVIAFGISLILAKELLGAPHINAATDDTVHPAQSVSVQSESQSQVSFAANSVDPLHSVQHVSEVAAAIEAYQAPDFALPPIENGMAPVLLKVPTAHNVVFATIDDGAIKDPAHLRLLTISKTKATLFLANSFISNNPSFFKTYLERGHMIENHSRDHILKRHIPYQIQKDQICSEADIQQQQFGRRPLLYRPPGGFYDDNTRRAAADCGMKAVIMWHAKAESGKMMYQDGNHLLPGDIVLMHFRPEFPQDFAAFQEAQKAAGLHTELLEDWLL